MALNVSKGVPRSPILAKRGSVSRSQSVLLTLPAIKGSSAEELQGLCCTKPLTFVSSRRSSSTVCFLGKSQDTETKPHEDCLDLPNSKTVQKEVEKEVMPRSKSNSSQVLVEYVSNDAKFVNERARSDFVLLSRGIVRLDARARQDVAILGSGFLKLDARAREDTEKIDRDVKRKAERLHHIATILKNIAQSKLKNAADKHWSDGALEADLRRADFRAKQRAMEDALMALEFIKNIHDMMVQKMVDSLVTSETGTTDRISLEKNGKALEFFLGEVSSDSISAIEEAYKSMASALSEADGIDYTDPEELELLVTTLIDLDAMDGKSSASLLAECSSSPDVNTRKALANALAAAPSMWTLGNAGMGALQRLAEDSNPAIAAAASRAISALKKQWEKDMALSKPPPQHFSPFNNPNPHLETAASTLTFSTDSSRRIRRDVLLSVSGTIIPQLFLLDLKRSSSASAADLFSFLAPQPEPVRTVEMAKEGLRKNGENIKKIKEIMIENKRWKEGGKEIRRSASNMKQDLYLIIQAKPPKDRPLLRSFYSSLFSTITKLDYAARDGDATKDCVVDYVRRWVARIHEQTFEISISYPKTYLDVIESLIAFAVHKRVKNLVLDFSNPAWRTFHHDVNLDELVVEIPQSVYDLATLESLKVGACKKFDPAKLSNLGKLKTVSFGWMELKNPELFLKTSRVLDNNNDESKDSNTAEGGMLCHLLNNLLDDGGRSATTLTNVGSAMADVFIDAMIAEALRAEK
ncbi:unnamed protein product [Brassica napus]|nr:unnamed protein product [Brassica napus]